MAKSKKSTGRRQAPAERSYRAKVFRNGGSQAIRLPKECRVEAKEVSIRKEGASLIITPVSSAWPESFRKMFLEGPPRNTFPSLKELRRGLGKARDIVL